MISNTQALVLSTAIALAISLAPRSASAAASCGEDLRKVGPVLYSAKFVMGNVNEPSQKLRIVVGMPRALPGKHAPLFPVAQIWSGSECQALCRVQGIEKDTPLNPVALEMSCQGVGFSPLAVKAEVLWGGEKSAYMAKAPTIRFGTWLEGYRQSPLAIETDRYSMGAGTDRKIADLAKR